MGEVVKSCCYCCCTCYQSGVCCASLCCLVIPIVGLVLIVVGIVIALLLGFSMLHHESKELTLGPGLVAILAAGPRNLSQTVQETVNGTAAGSQ